MATLREIKRRITGVKSTQQITKAMKMVAAAKMRRAQERMFAARPYASKINELIQNLAAERESLEAPLLEERPVEHVTIVVITADRGLCGSFNSTIIKKAISEIKEAEGKQVDLVCIGRKAYDFFNKRGHDIGYHKINLFNDLTYDHALETANYLMDAFISGATDEVRVIYNEFKNVAQQNLIADTLLPIQVEESEEDSGARVDYIFEPSQAAILNALLPRHFRVQIWRAFLESYASEQAARMLAMENATENATELIATLTLDYNKARQAAITTEILEIVGGAEALKAS